MWTVFLTVPLCWDWKHDRMLMSSVLKCFLRQYSVIICQKTPAGWFCVTTQTICSCWQQTLTLKGNIWLCTQFMLQLGFILSLNEHVWCQILLQEMSILSERDIISDLSTFEAFLANVMSMQIIRRRQMTTFIIISCARVSLETYYSWRWWATSFGSSSRDIQPITLISTTIMI